MYKILPSEDDISLIDGLEYSLLKMTLLLIPCALWVRCWRGCKMTWSTNTTCFFLMLPCRMGQVLKCVKKYGKKTAGFRDQPHELVFSRLQMKNLLTMKNIVVQFKITITGKKH